jgi:predicted amidohydrolase
MTSLLLRVALAQIHCWWADTRGNLARMADWAERAKRGGEQLVFAEIGKPSGGE